MDSELLSHAQLTRLNAVRFKSIRRIFKVESSCYHRVLDPSAADCSNEYLASLAHRSERVITPSQLYSRDRLHLFGHMLRHPDSLEFQAAFMPSGAYRRTAGPNRLGQPRLHWAESCVVETSNRISYVLSDNPPAHSDIHNSYFEIPSASSVRLAHSRQSLVWMDNTLLYKKSKQFAADKNRWSTLIHKPKRA